MYCVKCKKNTNTTELKYSYSRNNKPMVRGKCTVCKRIKTSFISANEAEKARKGGFVFTLPAILGAASALGSLAGGAAGIATAVNKKKASDKSLAETKRHNLAMEKKAGQGLFLKPAKPGKGLFLNPY